MSDAPDEWIVINGMGGHICSVCGDPVESEPCAEHQPEAYAAMCALQRYPVSLFERVEGCFACENPKGLPIPLDEFPAGGDIGLCTRHWNWWLGRFAYVMNPTPEPPCSAHLLASEIERERAAMSKRAADVEVGKRSDV